MLIYIKSGIVFSFRDDNCRGALRTLCGKSEE
jgi:hypothetical protein